MLGGTQGDPISLNEQVLLESARMGSDWHLNYSRCRNLARDEVLEVNCLRHGRTFYLVLYSRNQKVGVQSTEMALTYPDTIRLFYPHLGGHLSASCSFDKREPRLRRTQAKPSDTEENAKDLWIVQPAAGNPPDRAVQWCITPILLRHLGSKKYLAVKEHDLVASGLLLRGEDKHHSKKVRKEEVSIRAELVNIPGPLCQFFLEPTGVVEAQAYSRGILDLTFSSSRFSRDSFVIQNMEGTNFLKDCEVVNEHRFALHRQIVPRCQEFDDDMIFFLTNSRHWRQDASASVLPDPLTEPWLALPARQHVSHQMKYIDASFKLFHELELLVIGDVRWGRRAAKMESKMHAREALASSVDSLAEVEAWEEVMKGMVATMKTRCLKLLVRLWLCTFLGIRKIESYFHKRRPQCFEVAVIGYLEPASDRSERQDLLNTLNGFGLGASDVFVKLVSNNEELARTMPFFWVWRGIFSDLSS
eukprot:s1124_g13.t1